MTHPIHLPTRSASDCLACCWLFEPFLEAFRCRSLRDVLYGQLTPFQRAVFDTPPQRWYLSELGAVAVLSISRRGGLDLDAVTELNRHLGAMKSARYLPNDHESLGVGRHKSGTWLGGSRPAHYLELTGRVDERTDLPVVAAEWSLSRTAGFGVPAQRRVAALLLLPENRRAVMLMMDSSYAGALEERPALFRELASKSEAHRVLYLDEVPGEDEDEEEMLGFVRDISRRLHGGFLETVLQPIHAGEHSGAGLFDATLFSSVGSAWCDLLTNVQKEMAAFYHRYADHSATGWQKSELARVGEVDIKSLWGETADVVKLLLTGAGSLLTGSRLRAACDSVARGTGLPGPPAPGGDAAAGDAAGEPEPETELPM